MKIINMMGLSKIGDGECITTNDNNLLFSEMWLTQIKSY